MYKKALGMFLMGTLFFFCSCVDDTYDLANKEIKTDMQIKGNKLAVPLGSLSPFMLDSLLGDMGEVSMFKVDSVSHSYSLSLDSSLVTRVEQKDLSVLEDAASLSATIDPVKIEMNEIKIDPITEKRTEELSFADIEIDEVALEETNEEVKLEIGEIKLDPIPVTKQTHTTPFNIPEVNVDEVPIGGQEPQEVSFSIDEINTTSTENKGFKESLNIVAPSIPMDNYARPALNTKESSTLDIKVETPLGTIDLTKQEDNTSLPSIILGQPIPVNVSQDMEGKDVSVGFSFTLPEQIESLNRVVLENSDNSGKGALIDFVLTNPTLLNGIASRTVSFAIHFPDNYVLNTYDNNYTVSTEDDETILAVENLDASGKETHIRFYMKEIKDLDDDDYYKTENGERKLIIDEDVEFNMTYKATGNFQIPSDYTTYGKVREGLTYSMSLDTDFDIEEVYGDINAVESELETKVLDFSFDLKDLDYVREINKVTLDPTQSVLKFSTSISEDLGDFDLEYPNSKLVLDLPENYVFADNIKLPAGVKRVGGTNDFEIQSIKALEGGQWEFPVKEVNVNTEADANGDLHFSATAYLKAISGGKEGALTIRAMQNLALIEATELLCKPRTIVFEAAPSTLIIEDVTGATNPIGIDLESKEFEMDFTIEDLEYIQSVDFVRFEEGQTITISSKSENNFSNIQFDEGSYITLCFDEKFIFDYDKCSLRYDHAAKGFIIDNLETFNDGQWTLAIKQIDIKENVKKPENTLSMAPKVFMKAVNNKGEADKLYIAAIDDFSLDKMRNDGLFGEYNITFTVEDTNIAVDEVEGATENINVAFEGETVSYDIKIPELKYITHIGVIDLKAGSNFLKFSSKIQKDLGNFDLASGSYIELKFPQEIELDPTNCTVPNPTAVEVTTNSIKVKSIKALNTDTEWKLAVNRIDIDDDIEPNKKMSYSIDVNAYDAQGIEDNLTIAAINPFRLSDVRNAGGKNSMNFTILKTEIEIEDIEATIEEMDFDFEAKTFEFPVSIPNLDKIDSVKYISFNKGGNQIALNIKLDGTSIAPFKLADKSVVKISFPKEFVLDEESCEFGSFTYNKTDNSLRINDISAIEDSKLILAIDRLQMDKDIKEEGTLEWNGVISVAALNTETNEEGKIYIAGLDNVKYTEVSNALSAKTISFNIPAVKFCIDEAVIVSNAIETEINKDVELKFNQNVPAAIDRVDRLGFTDRVPMTLKLTAKGLDKLNADVNLDMAINMPPVFDISRNDERVTITDGKLSFDIDHNFSTSNSLELKLYVNSLDFTKLADNYLALKPVEGKKDERLLVYEDKVSIVGSASIASAQLSSELLEEDIALDIAFEMGEVVLKNFTGIYGGIIDPVSSSFNLGIKNGFEELEKNGLTLANTKPELMITLYNSIGVPVDVDLAIIGKDAEGNTIPTAVIKPESTLRIRPAKLNEQNELVADTTRWLFTSNKDAFVPGYEVVVVENLENLLEELPEEISFSLTPTIVTEEEPHYVDLTKPLELGGSYSISMPFDLQFTQAIPLEFGEEVDAILRDGNNTFNLANPQLALSIHNPIAQELAFDLSLIGKDAEDKAIPTATLFDKELFVLAAGNRNADGSITPVPTRWLFAVDDSIKREGYETKASAALGTLLQEIPHKIDIALDAHFNTDLIKQIDYNNDLELLCEYGVLIPLQFSDLQFSYADTIATELDLNLEETLDEMGVSVSNVGLSLAMNLKNTLPIGLTLNLVPLDAQGNVISGIEIGSIELPAGNGADIASAATMEGTPVEFSIKCTSPAVLSTLDRISFSLDVTSGNGDNVLSGKQGLQVCDIVLQIMCDVETNLNM